MSTFSFDAMYTTLDDLLNDFTCVDQPSPADVLTVNLATGDISR
ncbi:hypothetical protein ACH4PU_30920 [Streptomyces sp. NPDC021100]